MLRWLRNPGRPLVIAHRGGAGLAPENTIAAFDNGLAQGADALELDVRLSRDGVAMVHHDATLDRTTNLGGALDGYSAAELERADATCRFRTAAGEPFEGPGIGVPRLAAVLARYPDVPIVIELKLNHPELARAVIADVRTAAAVDRVCLGSFGWRVLREARSLAPEVATSAAREEVRWMLYRSWIRWPRRHTPYGALQVPEVSGLTRIVSPRFVADAHRADVAVQVWTVNDVARARRLLAWNVDAIITDRPDAIVPVVVPAPSAPSLSDSTRTAR